MFNPSAVTFYYNVNDCVDTRVLYDKGKTIWKCSPLHFLKTGGVQAYIKDYEWFKAGHLKTYNQSACMRQVFCRLSAMNSHANRYHTHMLMNPFSVLGVWQETWDNKDSLCQLPSSILRLEVNLFDIWCHTENKHPKGGLGSKSWDRMCR